MSWHNNDYEGDPVAGSVKVPVRDDEVRVGDYDRSAGYSMATALPPLFRRARALIFPPLPRAPFTATLSTSARL